MPTNLNIDDNLILEAMKVGKHKTKKEAVTAALQDYILSNKLERVIGLFGAIDYEKDHDYKKRRAKSKSSFLKRSTAK